MVVLEYCVIFGSEAIVNYAKDSIYTIKTLKEFIHIDEKGRDKGILGKITWIIIIEAFIFVVREKSKDLVELLSDESLLAQCRLSGHLPNYTRPKSTEPILVDPKQRKRLGREDNNYSDLQNIDENEAMRMALSASRSANSRYQSLELDDDSESSEEEGSQEYHHNPFTLPAIDFMLSASAINDYEYAAIEANPFSNIIALAHEPQPQKLQIDNPFMEPQVKNTHGLSCNNSKFLD